MTLTAHPKNPAPIALHVTPTAIPDVKLLTPLRHRDPRGFFSETYSEKALADLGIPFRFVQDNHSLSALPGVLRGLHFQVPPMAQAKLLRVTRGRIFDVCVDIRRDSPTFGRHVTAELGADNWTQILVPPGFAHGFLTLEPDTEVIYKVSNYYSPAHDKGLLWNDPALHIPWPITPDKAILSDKDKSHPTLADLPAYF